MFGRNEDELMFSQDMKQVLAYARNEAISLGHDYMGTEHLVLGLIRDPDGAAVRLLDRAGIPSHAVNAALLDSVRHGKATVARGELPYTSRSKKSLEYALAFAKRLGSPAVEPEHLLLGVIAEEKGIGAQVLAVLGLTLTRAMQLLATAYHEADAANAAFRVVIDDSSERSIYEQIVAQVQEAVATGRLRPGERIQAVRQLADELNIAPGTVARAYSELELLGVVVTEGARGTRVAPQRQTGLTDDERPDALSGLLRPVAVAAFHLGATADELRAALEAAMKDIFRT